jgi:hypothetical protein
MANKKPQPEHNKKPHPEHNKKPHPEDNGGFTLAECARLLGLVEQGVVLPDGKGQDPTAWLLSKLAAGQMDSPEERYFAQRLVIRLERLRWQRDNAPRNGE